MINYFPRSFSLRKLVIDYHVRTLLLQVYSCPAWYRAEFSSKPRRLCTFTMFPSTLSSPFLRFATYSSRGYLVKPHLRLFRIFCRPANLNLARRIASTTCASEESLARTLNRI